MEDELAALEQKRAEIEARRAALANQSARRR